MSRKTVQIVLSVLIIGLSLSYMVSASMSEQIEYFHPADAVLAMGSELEGQRIRMGGFVVKDSILQRTGTLEYRFKVRPVPGMMKYPEHADGIVTVAFTGIVPDTFKDDAEVIVSGRVISPGQFEATDLLAKCPSKYEAEEKNKGTY